LGIVLVLLALLAVPVDLSYRLSVSAGVEGRLTIGWLFGLIRIPVRLGGKGAEKRAARHRKKPARKRKKARPGNARRLLTSAEFWQWFRHLLGRLLGNMHIYYLFLNVRLGLGDPADTGRLWALAGPMAAILASIPLADVRLEPNFMEAEFVLHSEGQLRIYPLGLIATLVATALSPTTWRVFRQRRAR